MRKLAVGKKVKVEMEYDRKVPTKAGANMDMHFAAVFETSKNRNLAVV